MKKTILCMSFLTAMMSSNFAMAAPTLSSIDCATDTITVTVGNVSAATSMSVEVVTATKTNTFEIQTFSPNSASELVMAFENDSKLLGTVNGSTSFSVTVGSNSALSGSCS